VHAVLLRKVRSPEEGENVELTIISIVCLKAKEAGKHYTKRLLPPFLIPYCQISRQGVMAYLGRFSDGRVEYAFGVRMLGARDIRTIRRHVAMGLATISAAALELASLLSGLPAHATLPARQLNESPGQSLQELSHLVSVVERSAGGVAIPLTSVLRAAVFHDSS
jgi:hypothetical protein